MNNIIHQEKQLEALHPEIIIVRNNSISNEEFRVKFGLLPFTEGVDYISVESFTKRTDFPINGPLLVLVWDNSAFERNSKIVADLVGSLNPDATIFAVVECGTIKDWHETSTLDGVIVISKNGVLAPLDVMTAFRNGQTREELATLVKRGQGGLRHYEIGRT